MVKFNLFLFYWSKLFLKIFISLKLHRKYVCLTCLTKSNVDEGTLTNRICNSSVLFFYVLSEVG